MLVVALVAATACREGLDTPQGVAERFLDDHYVRIDLPAARSHTVGAARAKVEEEQHLVGDQVIDASTRRPHVSYDLKEQREEGSDRVTFLFEGRIRVEDADTFTRRWLISTRKEPDGSWKVSNFQEFE
jgi:hypothetical protein